MEAAARAREEATAETTTRTTRSKAAEEATTRTTRSKAMTSRVATVGTRARTASSGLSKRVVRSPIKKTAKNATPRVTKKKIKEPEAETDTEPNDVVAQPEDGADGPEDTDTENHGPKADDDKPHGDEDTDEDEGEKDQLVDERSPRSRSPSRPRSPSLGLPKPLNSLHRLLSRSSHPTCHPPPPSPETPDNANPDGTSNDSAPATVNPEDVGPKDTSNDGAPTTVNPKDVVPKTIADPTKPADVSLEGRTWAERNPNAIKQPGKEREKGKDKQVGAAEKATLKLKRKVKVDAKEAWEKELAEFEAEVDKRAGEMAKTHNKTYSEVRKALRGVTTMAKEHAQNVQHAKVWALSKEINKDRPRGERLRAHEVAKLTKTHPPFMNMTQEEERLLLDEYEEEREKKDVGVRLNDAAAAKDVTAFTKRVDHELNNLQKRTGAIRCLLIGRSDVSDTLLPACVGPEDGMCFFPLIMRTTNNDFATKWDHFTVNRDRITLDANFNELCKTCTSMISEGFERATGSKTVIKYVEYDKLVLKHGVELVGWPESVPFKSPSDLNRIELLRPLYDALMNDSCRWEKMSEVRKTEHAAAVASKPAKAKTMEGSGKRKRGEAADGDTPKKKRTKLSDLTKRQRIQHARKIERRHKRHQRARHHGAEITGIASDSDTDTNYGDLSGSDTEKEKEKEKGNAKTKTKGKGKDNDENEGDDDVPPPRNLKRAKKSAVKSSEFVEDTDDDELPRGPGPLCPDRSSSSSGSESEDERPSLNLPFSAKPNKGIRLAKALAKEMRQAEKKKQKQRRLSSNRSPSKSPRKSGLKHVAKRPGAPSSGQPAASSNGAPANAQPPASSSGPTPTTSNAQPVASPSRLQPGSICLPPGWPFVNQPVASTSRLPPTQPVASTSRLPPALTQIGGYDSGTDDD
ncbi:hypothetical protein C8R46DRAFT_1220376 [Mycena filopes]|nr:hypothetical protein C8R46DRAFT_1220376 [Mycena filopes]